ncbi:F-box protein [Quillaja saponaria]|uniref:F-box protein n=1 Tax=Quillaja saponaria TaxID=32244 RepID=A0AAD7PWZ7_QUISA|nr:F-box protein [Quillaja saponaria]
MIQAPAIRLTYLMGKHRMLPNFVQECYIGFSGGYLIMENFYCQPFLLNPFTGEELLFPKPPLSFNCVSPHDRVILASMPSKDFVLLALSMGNKNLQVFLARDSVWDVYTYVKEPWMLVDIVVLDGRAYVVTNKGQLGFLSLSPLNLTFLEIKNITPTLNSFNLKLVTSDQQLLMVDFIPGHNLAVYRMGFLGMEWVKIDSLGDQALFCGGRSGSELRKPGRWGGRSNCVYYIDSVSKCYMYSMDATLIEGFRIEETSSGSPLLPLYWYYPHQYCNTHQLQDE